MTISELMNILSRMPDDAQVRLEMPDTVYPQLWDTELRRHMVVLDECRDILWLSVKPEE